jgi:lipopolysaccharide biosynthesis glycosyltransferase
LKGIHIVSVANNDYARPLAVMLYSLLENSAARKRIIINIIDDGILYQNKLIIRKVIHKFHSQVRFLNVNKSLYQDLRTNGRFGREVYYRISIPELLESEIEKAIYLDCDLIVQEDIERLWSINLGEHFLAAVKTPAGEHRRKVLSIPRHSYFNSGVMVLNLRKWRLNNISQKVIRFIKSHPMKIKFPDQDGLNAILYNKWLRLHPKWNYYTSYNLPLAVKPSIIHYNGNRKPWSHNPPLKQEFIKYMRKTFRVRLSS